MGPDRTRVHYGSCPEVSARWGEFLCESLQQVTGGGWWLPGDSVEML